jgi:hypothetical protein
LQSTFGRLNVDPLKPKLQRDGKPRKLLVKFQHVNR